MRAIFISYRRDDAEGEAGRLFDDLANVYGENSVFMDVAAIGAGQDFRKVIDQSVATCGVLLAIIGKNWVDAKDESGQRRLDSPSDFVRLETASALKRDIPVIPVIVHGARMPRTDQLPDDLKDLAYRNCVELTGARWRSDVQLLINALRPHVGEAKDAPVAQGQAAAQPAIERTPAPSPEPEAPTSPRATKKPLGLLIGGGAALLILVAVAVYMLTPNKVVVPDLTGMTAPDATAKLQSLNLVVGRRTTREEAAKDPNTILNQSPAPNSRVNSGTAVNLVISELGARGQGQGGMRPNPPGEQNPPKLAECSPTYSTANTPRYRLIYVWSSDRSALGADVLLDGKCQGRIESEPDSSNVSLLVPVPPGSYDVRVEKRGFPDFDRSVKAAPPAKPPAEAAKIPVEFSLTPR
jgi:PASTA domain/TIR domain